MGRLTEGQLGENPMSDIVKVKRDGPRGWHWIARAKFDPELHEEYRDEDEEKPRKPRQRKEV